MEKALVLISAIAVRAIPIIFGVIISRRYDAIFYSDFVYLLAFVNLLANIPIVVTNSIVLTSNKLDGASVAIVGFVFSIVPAVVLIALAPAFLVESNYKVFTAIYFAGTVASSVAQNLVIKSGRYLAGCVQATAVLGLSVAFALLLTASDEKALANYPLTPVVLVYSAVSVLWLFFLARCALPGLTGFLRKVKFGVRNSIKNVVLNGLFGGIFMFGMLLLNGVAASGNSEERVSISLGMQLFGVVIFIPGALGSYYVPKLVNAASSNDRKSATNKMIVLYSILGVGFFLGVVVLLPALLSVYQVALTRTGTCILLLVVFSAVFAGTNAAITQYSISASRFDSMFGSAVLWISLVLIVVSLLGDSAFVVPTALIAAYAGATIWFYLALGIGVQK